MTHTVEVSGEFPFSAARYLEIYFDPGYAAYTAENSDVREYTVESIDRSETHIARTIKVVPNVELPPWLQKIIKSGRIAYLETVSHKIGTTALDMTYLPSVLTNRLQITGVIELKDLGENRCLRTSRMDIKVSIFGLGPRIEEHLGDAIKGAFAGGTEHMVAYDATLR